eukprot:gene13730-19629_t
MDLKEMLRAFQRQDTRMDLKELLRAFRAVTRMDLKELLRAFRAVTRMDLKELLLAFRAVTMRTDGSARAFREVLEWTEEMLRASSSD